MKAVIYRKYGSPDVIELQEVENPTPKDDEVLIKVHATTVNRTDTATLRAKPFIIGRLLTGIFKPNKPISGTEFSGEIEAVGKEVSSFKVGDKVFGFEDKDFGSHAQYKTISEGKGLTTIPENVTYEQAAASTEGAHYAYSIIKRMNIKRGQKVLVNGATGAIGSAAVQLLKYFDANVTAVCNTNNIEMVKSLGADKIIDYTKEDLQKMTKNITSFLTLLARVHFSSARSCYNLAEFMFHQT